MPFRRDNSYEVPLRERTVTGECQRGTRLTDNLSGVGGGGGSSGGVLA